MNSVFDRLGVDYLEQDRSEVGKPRFRGRSRTLGYFGIPGTSAEAFDVTEIVLTGDRRNIDGIGFSCFLGVLYIEDRFSC
jgi:hypothetical protein